MGPFTNRQTAYIRAVAGKSSHKSFIVKNYDGTIGSSRTTMQSPANLHGDSNPMTMVQWLLTASANCLDSRPANTSTNVSDWSLQYDVVGMGPWHELNCLNCPKDISAQGENIDIDASTHVHDGASPVSTTEYRIGNQAFLESTHLQFRFIMPGHVDVNPPQNQVHSMDTPHYEWRFIIFRNKRPGFRVGDGNQDFNTVNQLRDGVSLANPGYDLFMGQAGRPRGTLGWRTHMKFDHTENVDDTNQVAAFGSNKNGVYAGVYFDGSSWQDGSIADITPPGEDLWRVDDYLTARLNRNDYVIHTDERFFLGQQFGKSHYEKTVHFDWKDFIDTPYDDLTTSPTLDGKNYDWHFMLIGTSNTSNNNPELDVHIRSTTTLTSGE
jgi:hypothetical protein